jgi:Uma2 family endonuclease
MNQPSPKPFLAVEDYIEGELHSEVKHEYLAGEVYAMAGASRAHNLITRNLGFALHRQLRGGPCQVFMSDMKVRLHHIRDDYFYYPDVMVACRPEDNARYWCEQPKLLIEVLSESTERVDTREKLFAYQTIADLVEYVVLAQDRREVIVYRRTAGEWISLKVAGEGELELASVGLVIGLAEIYEGVEG